jgi:hypothetical protein
MNTKLIIGAIIGLLIIGLINKANAQCGYYRGAGSCGYYGPPRVYGGCGGGGYYGGGYYGGGWGGGWNSYGVAQTATTLGGIAGIICAATPIITSAIQQPVYVQQPQQPQVIIIQK